MFLSLSFDPKTGKSWLAPTRLVQLLLYLPVTLIGRADALPVELKTLVDQVIAIGLHFLLIDWRESWGGPGGCARPIGVSRY